VVYLVLYKKSRGLRDASVACVGCHGDVTPGLATIGSWFLYGGDFGTP